MLNFVAPQRNVNIQQHPAKIVDDDEWFVVFAWSQLVYVEMGVVKFFDCTTVSVSYLIQLAKELS